MTPSKIRRAAVLAATSFSAVALLTAGGLAGADGAAAQEATQSYVGQMRYDGDLPFDSRAIILQVVCDAATSGTSPGSCHAEGTFTIKVTAAAKQKLGLSSATVGRGVLKNYGAVSLSGGRELTIPAAVKPKLKAFYNKAQKKCGDCGHASPVAGRVSVSLTGPQGLPHETLRDSVVLWIGSRYARGDKSGWAWDCTSNWYGPCTAGSSGQPPNMQPS